MEEAMFYTILLNKINEKHENYTEGLEALKELSKENFDLIENKTFPVIICRMASQTEKEFYEEISVLYGFDITVRELKQSEDVFYNFELELKQKEQEDFHLQDKATVLTKLSNGYKLLNLFSDSKQEFDEASENIRSYICERKENILLKFFPSDIFLSFVAWLLLGVLFMFSQKYAFEDKIFLVSLMFCGIMGITVLYDFIMYKKKKIFCQSEKCLNTLIQKVGLQNSLKNKSLNDLEDVIDSLEVRNCLTVLQSNERNITCVENYIEELNTQKSIDEVFMLH
jgi:hypothetical protein